MSSTIILGRDGSNNDLVPLACSSAGVLSTSATLGDLSARQTIADSSTSTSLLCDAAGNLQIDVVSSAIPTGAATQTTLASIDGNITACNTGAVTTASSALPAGAATQSYCWCSGYCHCRSTRDCRDCPRPHRCQRPHSDCSRHWWWSSQTTTLFQKSGR